MKAQLLATAALVLLNATPGVLAVNHHDHLVDFEEESPSSVHSVSLRGASATVAAEEDAPDEDEELIQYGYYNNYSVDWRKFTTGVPYTARRWRYVPNTPYIPPTSKVGRIYIGGGVDVCAGLGHSACRAQASCNWDGSNCSPENLKDEDFEDSQDFDLDASPDYEDELDYEYDYDEEDEESK